jgi:hypothetical protein
MSNDTLFSDAMRRCFSARLKEVVVDSANIPFIIAISCFQVLVLCAVGILEWEIIYRVFAYLTEDNDYWLPEVMAITAMVMIASFHILGVTQPHNIAVRFVNRTVGLLIPLYMVGVGLLIASILDVGSIIQTDLPLPQPGELPPPIEASWIERVFSEVTTPLAALVFSLGLGGLAIVNIFVAHYLITQIKTAIQKVSGQLATAKQAIADHRFIVRCQKDYAALQQQLDALESLDDASLRLSITAEVLSLIAGTLWQHKQFLSTQEVNGTSEFVPASTTNANHIAKVIEQIEEIDRAEIIKHTYLEVAP